MRATELEHAGDEGVSGTLPNANEGTTCTKLREYVELCQAAGVGNASSQLRTSQMQNSARVTGKIVHAVCNVGALLGWRVASSPAISASKSGSGRVYRGWCAHPDVGEYVKRQPRKDVEDVDVVVTPCRPRMSEVQKLKREVCSVGQEKGGNEVCQEASALLSIGPLSV